MRFDFLSRDDGRIKTMIQHSLIYKGIIYKGIIYNSIIYHNGDKDKNNLLLVNDNYAFSSDNDNFITYK